VTLALLALSVVVALLGRRVIELHRLSRQQFDLYTAEFERHTETQQGLLHLAGRVGAIDTKTDAQFKAALANRRALAAFDSEIRH
jgi:hypothetical protein